MQNSTKSDKTQTLSVTHDCKAIPYTKFQLNTSKHVGKGLENLERRRTDRHDQSLVCTFF